MGRGRRACALASNWRRPRHEIGPKRPNLDEVPKLTYGACARSTCARAARARAPTARLSARARACALDMRACAALARPPARAHAVTLGLGGSLAPGLAGEGRHLRQGPRLRAQHVRALDVLLRARAPGAHARGLGGVGARRRPPRRAGVGHPLGHAGGTSRALSTGGGSAWLRKTSSVVDAAALVNNRSGTGAAPSLELQAKHLPKPDSPQCKTPKVDRICPSFGSESRNYGPMSAHFDRCWPGIGQAWLGVDRIGAEFAQVGNGAGQFIGRS